MSVYEEICEWIVEDYLDAFDAGESPDLDAIMEQNLIMIAVSKEIGIFYFRKIFIFYFIYTFFVREFF